MRTSGSCRRSKRRSQAASGGFSLLEMLVVLVLTSMTVALVGPRLSRSVEAIASSGDRAEVIRQLQELPLLARAQAAGIVLADQDDLSGLLTLPEGWAVTALSPLSVKANGVCTAGRVRVSGAGVVEEWALSVPDCRVGDGR